MHRKRFLTLLTCIVAILTLNMSAFADVNDSTATTVNEIAYTSIADYMASYFPEDATTDLDREIVETIRHLETQTNVSAPISLKAWNRYGIVAYLGEPTECFRIYANLSTTYGFIPARLRLYIWNNSLGYDGLGSRNESWASSKDEYIRVAEKAKAIAPTLVGSTNMETVQNIYNYVTTNAAMSGEDDGYDKYSGFYDGKYILCGGYAGTIAQLCKLNHIQSEVIFGVHNVTRHGWNKVIIDGKEYYVDGALRTGIVETLPAEYVAFKNSSEAIKSGLAILSTNQ